MAAPATTAASTMASLTRPEIRLSIINNLISLNWRELATTQQQSQRPSQAAKVAPVGQRSHRLFMIDRRARHGASAGSRGVARRK